MPTLSPSSPTVRLRRVSITLVFVFAYLALMFHSSASSLISTRNVSPRAAKIAPKQGRQGAASCPTCAPPTTQVIYAPLIDVPEALSSEIVLNCRSAHDIDVTPTLYTMEGRAIGGEVIHLRPAEMRFVDTKSLIPARERFLHRWGGMSLSYTGNLLEVWAQLTLKGLLGGGSANVFFAVVNLPRANTIESVWWMPPGAEALIALGNSSNQPAHATLIFRNGVSRIVDIEPFATKIVRRSEVLGLLSSDADRAQAVSINYTGAAGSLIPTGFITSAQGRFTSTIRFYNPPNVVQPNLYANNLRLKDATPHMVLRNTSSQFVMARPRFLTAEGATAVELRAQRLAPAETLEVNLRTLLVAARNRSDLDSVSVQVTNDGAPGSLIGALFSQHQTTGVTYDVPLRDSGSPRASTGAYPVRLDADYTTVLSITNVTDNRGEFTLQVNYDGGTYELGLVTANPRETKNFDIRKLRDEQTPDRNGHTLPREMTTGQIRWSIRGNGTIPMTGRAEVVSLHDGVSSSYSCTTCCPNSHYDGWLDPGYFSIYVGGLQTVGGIERQRDCYGNIYGPNDSGSGTWYAGNSDIASVDSNGQVEGVSEGTAGFSFTLPVYYWMQDFDEQCIPFESSDTENSTTDVTDPVSFEDASEEGGETAPFVGNIPFTSLNTTSCGGERFGIKIRFHFNDPGTITSFDSSVSPTGMFALAPSLVDGTYVEYQPDANPKWTKTYLKKVRSSGSKVFTHILQGTSNGKSFKVNASVTLNCH